jgi:hypothetical protein
MIAKYHKFLFIFAVVVVSGCAAPELTGPTFTEQDEIPSNQSIVYLYWTDRMEQLTHMRVKFEMVANGHKLLDLSIGGYHVFLADPGELVVTSSANFTFGQMGALDVAMTPKKEITLNIEPGKRYFIRGALTGRPGRFQLHLTAVDEGRGLYEIRSAKLIDTLAAQ